LGRGGMGTVYLAAEPDGRRVAVKVVNRELAGEPAFLARFRREVTAARRVHRFCTAPVLDAELDQDPPYIVTEYIDGPSLEKAVESRGPLPGSDLEGLAVGVATALAAIHGAGIVHRDLKPANVLLSSTGPRVIDFGIARALDATDGPTRTGQFVGTPNYLPPELLRGEQVTPASDVFSWGCVVAYAGTGRAPFSGNTVPEIFYRVAHDEPQLDGPDPGLRDTGAAPLAKDPRNRPARQALAGRLPGHGTTRPARPRRPAPGGRPRRRAHAPRRRRSPASRRRPARCGRWWWCPPRPAGHRRGGRRRARRARHRRVRGAAAGRPAGESRHGVQRRLLQRRVRLAELRRRVRLPRRPVLHAGRRLHRDRHPVGAEGRREVLPRPGPRERDGHRHRGARRRAVRAALPRQRRP